VLTIDEHSESNARRYESEYSDNHHEEREPIATTRASPKIGKLPRTPECELAFRRTVLLGHHVSI
jgi:hypothetical protein